MSKYRELSIGDASTNGQVQIVDKDRLCYIVRNSSSRGFGDRTISKALVDEFVHYFELHPNASPVDARAALSGTSNIDKFEYGYNSTLTLLAKMVLSPNSDASGANTLEFATSSSTSAAAVQKIFFGAPGTGKSHSIKRVVGSNKCVRVTFHPDSDYSTFVGAYKPTMVKKNMYGAQGVLRSSDGKEVQEDSISYSFVPQAFLKAYTAAWESYAEKKPVFLVIEEINRGNCAQIFGDLFQLLDRNDEGFSDYSIDADEDLRKYLEQEFKGLTLSEEDREYINGLYPNEANAVGDIMNGVKLLLPSNLSIYASMNTSDQSLFPIDSAFKRRWEWEYVPIENAGKNWKIVIGSKKFDWWTFVQAINAKIDELEGGEDKKLGYFFVKAKDGVVDENTFKGKVIFYLWNDVFKDYGFDSDVFNDENGERLTFGKFYDAQGSGKILKFMANLGVEADGAEAVDSADEADSIGEDQE